MNIAIDESRQYTPSELSYDMDSRVPSISSDFYVWRVGSYYHYMLILLLPDRI